MLFPKKDVGIIAKVNGGSKPARSGIKGVLGIRA
jgi:hypothetical protein